MSNPNLILQGFFLYIMFGSFLSHWNNLFLRLLPFILTWFILHLIIISTVLLKIKHSEKLKTFFIVLLSQHILCVGSLISFTLFLILSLLLMVYLCFNLKNTIFMAYKRKNISLRNCSQRNFIFILFLMLFLSKYFYLFFFNFLVSFVCLFY
jgi:hypothetical protein